MSFALVDELRVLPHVMGYEWRKASAFRMGFVLREVLRGIGRLTVMTFVYFAMFASSGATEFRGYRIGDLIAYLAWGAMIQKCVPNDKAQDVAEQIFDGYITKYLVMPVNFFTLISGKFLQTILLQLVFATLFWVAGALLLPAYWPYPISALSLLQATLLCVLGAYCYLLVYFILSCLAFWLDVVWSLLVMFTFVAAFVSGALVPVALMPEIAQHAFRALFPYWTVFAPIEILLGRQGNAQFVQGLGVLGLSLMILAIIARFTWRRGLRRFAGAGA